MFFCNSSLILTEEYLLLRHNKIINTAQKQRFILPWSGRSNSEKNFKMLLSCLLGCLKGRLGYNGRISHSVYSTQSHKNSGKFQRINFSLLLYKSIWINFFEADSMNIQKTKKLWI